MGRIAAYCGLSGAVPRIRTIKPELFASPQVMNVAVPARLLFVGLISQSDDEGRGSADPRKLRAAIFPGDKYPPATIRKWLEQLARQGLVALYDAPAHGELYALPTWRRHQKVDHPRASSYPPPPDSAKPREASRELAKPRGGSDLILPEGTEGSLRARAREGRAPRKTGEERLTHIKAVIARMPADWSDADLAKACAPSVEPQPTPDEIRGIRANGGAT